MRWSFRFQDRRMEWMVAAYTALFGVWLLSPIHSLIPATFDAVLEIMPEHVWALVFTGVGLAHLAALAINGAAWWTPFARAGAAVLNLLAYAILTSGIYATVPQTASVITYGYVVASLIVVVFLALRDCFLLRRAWRAQRTHP